VGEEDSNDLRSNVGLREKVWGLVRETMSEGEEGEKVGGKLGSMEEMMDAIDLGNYAGGRTGRRTYWVHC